VLILWPKYHHSSSRALEDRRLRLVCRKMCIKKKGVKSKQHHGRSLCWWDFSTQVKDTEWVGKLENMEEERPFCYTAKDIKYRQIWQRFLRYIFLFFFLFCYFFSLFLLLFICAYKAWVISPPCPHPLPYHPLHPLPPPLNTQQKLFCPYL
jgi:hypothetical protein